MSTKTSKAAQKKAIEKAAEKRRRIAKNHALKQSDKDKYEAMLDSWAQAKLKRAAVGITNGGKI